MSIFFALPMYGGFCMAPFFKSCLELKESLHSVPHEICIISNESAVHRARNQLAKSFMESDYERLMFIDSDIEFNADDVGKLWSLDVDIAVGAYSMKKIGAKCAAWVNGKLLDNLDDYDVPIEVDYAGTGFMMIKRKVFEKMIPFVDVTETEEGKRTQFFHFPIKKDESGSRVELSEDYEFCRMAKSLGFEVIMDPSIKLKHYGLHGFG